MVIGAIGAGAIGGAGINIVIRAIDKFSGVFSLVNKRLLLIGAGAVIAGGLIAGGMIKAGKAAAIVETEYAKVNTLLEEGQDAQKLYGKFVQETNVLMGNQGDQISALSGLYQTISAGITDTAEAQEFMNKATIAAVGGSAELSDVILAGTKAIAAFGLDVSDTERVMDAFAGTVKAGQTTMGELAQAFPTVAGMAGQAGLSIEETLGTFAGLTKVLSGSEETATSLSATIRGFIKPTTDMTNAVQAMGFESASAMIKEKGLNESLRMLNEHVDGDTEAIARLFPNVRALKAVFPLLGLSAEDVAASIDIVTNSAGLSQKQFEDMANTVQFQWGVAMSHSKNTLIDIGRVINTTLAPAIGFLAKIIEKLSKLWLNLPEPIKKVMVAFAAIAATILIIAGVILIMVGLKALLIALFVGAATAIWAAVAASIAFVAVNIWWIAIIAAVIAVIAALVFSIKWLIKNWEKVTDFLKKTFAPGIEFVTSIIKLLTSAFRWLWDNGIGWLWEKLKKFFIWIKDKFLGVLEKIISAIKFITGSKIVAEAEGSGGRATTPFGPQQSFTAGGQFIAPVIGSRQAGGFIPKTGAYLLHKGENVIPSGAGSGINVFIENVNGLDPDEIAEALQNKLDTMIST